MVIFLEKADLNSIRQPFVERSAISNLHWKKYLKNVNIVDDACFGSDIFLLTSIRKSETHYLNTLQTSARVSHLYSRISAAWRTGYVKRPTLPSFFCLLFICRRQHQNLDFGGKQKEKNQTCSSRKVWFKFSLSLWKSRFHFYVSLILGQTGVDEFAPHFPACFRSDLNQKIVVFYTRVGGKCEVKKKKTLWQVDEEWDEAINWTTEKQKFRGCVGKGLIFPL